MARRPHLNCFAVLALLGDDPKLRRREFSRQPDPWPGRPTTRFVMKDSIAGSTLSKHRPRRDLSRHRREVDSPGTGEIHRWLVKRSMEGSDIALQIVRWLWLHLYPYRSGKNGLGIDECAHSKSIQMRIRKPMSLSTVEPTSAATSGMILPVEGDMRHGSHRSAVLAHALDAKRIQGVCTPIRPLYQAPDTFSDTHGSPILGMVWTAPALPRTLLPCASCSMRTVGGSPCRSAMEPSIISRTGTTTPRITLLPRASLRPPPRLVLTLPKRNLKMTQLLLR